jgi:N-acetylglucosaminyldiphosphoundecaprenol N-acetyl-beta-D-mannosaminyltransferase
MDAESAKRRVDVLGVGVSTLPAADALSTIESWIGAAERHYVCFTSVVGIMEATRDRDYARIQNSSGLSLPDGMPLVWAGHYAGAAEMERVRGPDFMLALCERAAARGWSCFFFGAAPGTAERLAANLRQRFGGLRVAGTFAPPFRPLTEAEEDDVADRINRSGADIVWIGISTPKQERFMDRMLGRIEAPVMLGVGAAFDIHAGLVREAPRWWMKTGLEWLYWILVQPRRRLRQFARTHPHFVVQILRRRPFLRPVEQPAPSQGEPRPAGSP